MALSAPVRVHFDKPLAEGETLVFSVELYGRTREAFLLRHAGSLRAFLNECPHWAVELDLGDGHFFDPELGRIYCKNHGALFSPKSGYCETGPCLGRSLVQFTIEEDPEGATVGPGYVIPDQLVP